MATIHRIPTGRFLLTSLLLAVTMFGELHLAFGAEVLSGDWELQTAILEFETEAECAFRQTDGTLRIICQGAQGSVSGTGTVSGKQVTFKFAGKYLERPFEAVFSGTSTSSQISGTVDIEPFHIAGRFTARRRDRPELGPAKPLVTFPEPGWAVRRLCESLKTIQLPQAEVLSATLVPEKYMPSVLLGFRIRDGLLPAHCAVNVLSRPTADSEIGIEVWLPAGNWNGKYMQVGNGGWAGTIPTMAMAGALQRGYATAGTDNGHKAGNDAVWAIGHPEKVIDFGYRALQQTAVLARALIKSFYGREARYRYFVGCSGGGREALIMAQRFPEEFHGILVGAPANYWTGQFVGFTWNLQAQMGDSGAPVRPAQLAAIQNAALAACDSLDGVKDGLIDDPRQCHFDPAVLTCKGSETNECLTPAQVAAVSKIYSGPKNPRTGEQIFPGFPPGGENVPGGWMPWIVHAKPEMALQYMFCYTHFGHVVLEQEKWDMRTFDFDQHIALAERKAGTIIDATNPDLRSFRAHGGKIIQYHGWGDAALTPLASLLYYESVKEFLNTYPDPRSGSAKSIEDFYRLFMVPGLGHCAGGVGPNEFGQTLRPGKVAGNDPERDIIAALERWVEKGIAPDRIVASGKPPLDPSKSMTRLLCPYPLVARYKGTGDPYDAGNFECAAPSRPR